MFINTDWFRLSLMIMSICLGSSFNKRVILSVLWCIYAMKCINKKERKTYLLFLILIVLCSVNIRNSDFSNSRITAIKQNYHVVTNGISSLIVYTDDESAGLDDRVRIEGKIEEISSNNNFDFSTFEDYCQGNRIIGSINIENYETIEKSSSLRNRMYQHNMETGNLWANMFLFSKNSMDIDSDSSYYLLSSGMYISFFIGTVRSVIERYCYRKTSLKLTILFTLIMGWIFRFPYGYVRVLLSLLCEYFISDRKQGTGIQIVFMCFYKPYYVKSLSFLLPFGLKIISLFCKKENRAVSCLYIILLQLMIYGKVSLLSVLSFSLLRSLFGRIYCCALLVSLLPWEIRIEWIIKTILKISDSLPSLYLKGAVHPLLFLFLVFLLLEYSQAERKKYLLVIMAVLLINSNRLLFCPFYTVTFADVGQGDCCIVTQPFSNTALMIDTGGNRYRDIAAEILIPYLDRETIRKVEVIITHDDYDHCGALQNLCLNGYVKNIYRDRVEEIQCGKLKICNPLFENVYDNDNDNSLIQYFEIDRFSFLLLADITSAVERNLVQQYNMIKPDVVKLAHHGSATSTSDYLLAGCQPELAVISAGRNNYYNHPAKSVIDRLESYRIPYLNTKEDKAIRFYIFHRVMICVTAEKEIKIMFG